MRSAAWTDRPRIVLVSGGTGSIGQAPSDLEPLSAALDPDAPNSLDGVRDEDNMPPGRAGAGPR